MIGELTDRIPSPPISRSAFVSVPSSKVRWTPCVPASWIETNFLLNCMIPGGTFDIRAACNLVLLTRLDRYLRGTEDGAGFTRLISPDSPFLSGGNRDIRYKYVRNFKSQASMFHCTKELTSVEYHSPTDAPHFAASVLAPLQQLREVQEPSNNCIQY